MGTGSATETKSARCTRRSRWLASLGTALLIWPFLSTGSLANSGLDSSLEADVWTGEDADLTTLEQRVVRSLQLEPRSPRNHYLMAHVLVRMFSRDPSQLHLLKQASDLAQQAVDIEPYADFGYVALADILDLMGHTAKAENLLREAEGAGVRPTWRTKFTRARLLADRGDSRTVLKLLEDALSDKDSLQAVIAPYVVAILQNDAEGTTLLAELTSWNSRFPNLVFKQTMAVTLSGIGKYKDAHEIYRIMATRYPGNKETQVNDAVLLYRHLGQPKLASARLTDVLSTHRKSMSAANVAMVAAHLGAAALKTGDHAKAENAFMDSMVTSPDFEAALAFLAGEYRSAGKVGRLADLLRRTTLDVPGRSAVYALLGETLSDGLGRHPEAVRAFRDAIAIEPGRSDYYNGLGLTHYRMKAIPEALRAFSQAVRVDPTDATARYNEACALALLGRANESIESLAEALRLDPRLIANARTDRDFISLKNDRGFRELVAGSTIADGEKTDGVGVGGDLASPAH